MDRSDALVTEAPMHYRLRVESIWLMAAMLARLFCAPAMANAPAVLPHSEKALRTESSENQIVATNRDRYGRIRVAVLIDGRGPFSLIVDTGANRSAVSANVARSLGLPLDQSPPLLLRGVTGNTPVPAIRVQSLSVAGLTTPPTSLPIVLDAQDGADGFLSVFSLTDRSIVIDLRGNALALAQPRSAGTVAGFVRIPVTLSRKGMLVIDVRVQGVPVKAVVDTGAQTTIGNMRLCEAVTGQVSINDRTDTIVGTTSQAQYARTYSVPPIELGPLRVHGVRMACGDISIFNHIALSNTPAMLLGMDVLGQFDFMIIDYRNRQLQLLPSRPQPSIAVQDRTQVTGAVTSG